MTGPAARLATMLVLAGVALAVTASSGAGAVPARAPLLGAVPHAGGAHLLHSAAAAAGAAAPDDVSLLESPCTPPACWVMRTNTTYAIYWVPAGFSVQSGYANAVDQFLIDIAAASGSQTNVNSVATQYYDSTGFVGNQSTFGGSTVDTDPFPANGCNDADPADHIPADPVCLTDQQIQAEIQKVIAAKGWPAGPNSLFFILTPETVGSCFDSFSPSAGGQCSTNVYCAYHSGFTVNNQPVLYANEPYDAQVDGCAVGPSPNGTDADATINTVSHEQNEAITDPWGNAWLNPGGDEIADICAWQFGAALGGTGSTAYNQVINGHHYALQEDYSNDGSICRQSYVGLPANTVPPALSGTAVQGQSLSASAGSWTQAPTGYAYQWLRCAPTGGSCTAISGATAATYPVVAADSGHTLEVQVAATNARGTKTADSQASAVVIGIPASAKAPRISGRAKVGRKLTASTGSWIGVPKTYSFQWLRCNRSGGSCVSIKRATRSAYRLTKRDARHRLRVRVTAANVAGSKAATSRATTRVPVAKR